MFCPKCRSEYREGFDTCADCNIPLVDEIPELPEDVVEFADFEMILKTYNVADIATIKSVLEGEGISYYFKGEQYMVMQPLVEPARLMVRTDQVDAAKEVLKDLNITFVGMTTSKKKQF